MCIKCTKASDLFLLESMGRWKKEGKEGKAMKYIKAKAETILFDNSDVITTSWEDGVYACSKNAGLGDVMDNCGFASGIANCPANMLAN